MTQYKVKLSQGIIHKQLNKAPAWAGWEVGVGWFSTPVSCDVWGEGCGPLLSSVLSMGEGRISKELGALLKDWNIPLWNLDILFKTVVQCSDVTSSNCWQFRLDIWFAGPRPPWCPPLSWDNVSCCWSCWAAPGHTGDTSPGSRPSRPSLSGCSWGRAGVDPG